MNGYVVGFAFIKRSREVRKRIIDDSDSAN